MKNPYTPGAGHLPPYLAGRDKELLQFGEYLEQEKILKNLIITGLRGTGKTSLLESCKPIALQKNWLWVKNDFSESVSVSEENLAIRLITDLSLAVSSFEVSQKEIKNIGFTVETKKELVFLSYDILIQIFNSTPGMINDKLKAVLSFAWTIIQENTQEVKGIVFAYDEAQTLGDNVQEKNYPLSALLEVFQSLQTQEFPFFLTLTGLPTLMPKLIDTRTFSERFFTTISLSNLDKESSRQAIVQPLKKLEKNETFGKLFEENIFTEEMIDEIISESGGYPYFVQFICKESFDFLVRSLFAIREIPMKEIIKKLDQDFFWGRWNNLTEKQQELLTMMAGMTNVFYNPTEVSAFIKEKHNKEMSPPLVSKYFKNLVEQGMLYKEDSKGHIFAVPLLKKYILRNYKERQRETLQ